MTMDNVCRLREFFDRVSPDFPQFMRLLPSILRTWFIGEVRKKISEDGQIKDNAFSFTKRNRNEPKTLNRNLGGRLDS